jgi:hypothetical protein
LGGFKGSNGLERFREVQGGLERFRGVVRGFKGLGVLRVVFVSWLFKTNQNLSKPCIPGLSNY